MSVLRTKPIEEVLAQGDDDGDAPATGRLRRRLGPLDLMGFGIGIVIGTGIFTLTGIEAGWGLHRPFRVLLSPALPIVAALACLYLMTNLSMETWLRFLAWLAIGLVVYLGYGRRHSRLSVGDHPARPAAP